MTISEMHTAFEMELDKTNGLSYPSFESIEIDYWLNKAQKKFMRDTLHGTPTNPTNIGNSFKNIDALQTLVEEGAVTTTTSTNFQNGGQGAIPSDYAEAITARIRGNGLQAAWYNMHRITSENAYNLYKTPVNDPYIEEVYYYIEDDVLFYIYDLSNTDFAPSVDTVELIYYRLPVEVAIAGTDSELPLQTHDLIVSIAVNLAIESIEAPRYQTYTQVTKDTL